MLQRTAQFLIPSLPVSVNNGVRYNTRSGHSYKTKAYKEWEDFFTHYDIQQLFYSDWYRFDLLVGMNLFFKNGKIRNRDIDDMLKYSIDCSLARVRDEQGEIDDRRIIGGTFYKTQSDKDFTKIVISPIDINVVEDII